MPADLRALYDEPRGDPDVPAERRELPTLAEMMRDQVPSCDTDSLEGGRYLDRLY